MPKPAQSFIAEHARGNRKVFDTLDACLFEETKALHEDLIAAVTFLHFVDGVSIESQFERIRPKFTALKQKALEWQAARSARKEEFAQRNAADLATQEAYWAQFYANKEQIARAIARDLALKEQASRPLAPIEEVIEARTVRPEPVEENAAADPNACEVCGKPMRERMGKTGKFLGCSGYPTCRNTRPLPAHLATPAEPPAENPVEMRRAA